MRAASEVYERADAFDRDRAVARAELAEAELDAQELPAARADAEQALESARKTLPEAHPLLGSPLFALVPRSFDPARARLRAEIFSEERFRLAVQRKVEVLVAGRPDLRGRLPW